MHNYLPIKVAEYTSEELYLLPHGELVETPYWKQERFVLDGNIPKVHIFSNVTFFTVSFQFEIQTQYESSLIIDIYSHHEKARGSERTFYWHHPTDGHIYVVRFHPDMERVISFYPTVPNVQLWVEGVKA